MNTPDYSALFVVLGTSIVLWLVGYFDVAKKYPLNMPSWVRVIYGKGKGRVFLEGAIIQTLGIIIGVIYGLKHLGAEFLLRPQSALMCLSSILLFAVVVAEVSAKLAVTSVPSLPSKAFVSRDKMTNKLSGPETVPFERDLRRGIFALGGIVTATVISLGAIVYVVLFAYSTTGKVQLPYLLLISAFLLLALVGLGLFEAWLLDILTVFTTRGLKRPRLIGDSTFIEWHEIRHVDKNRFALRLWTQSRVVKIYLWLFKNPAYVMNEVKRYVEEAGGYVHF